MQSSNYKKDYIWNTAGSLLYALSSMVMAFFVTRLMGLSEGGIFGFGFSTLGQQMFIIAYFGIRPFHITDVKNEYSLSEYKDLRLKTSFSAMIFALLYLSLFYTFGDYGLQKAGVIFLLAIYKIIDGYADVYECECQRDGRLYVGGQALFFRTLLSMCGFMLVLFFTRGLLVSSLSAVLLQLLGLFVFDRGLFLKSFNSSEYSLKLEKKKIKELFISTIPLFLSVFLDFYIFSSAKYAIDWFSSDAQSGIFNILFMPTSVIYLFANFIIKPYMTKLASALSFRDKRQFDAIIRKLLKIIVFLIVLSMLGTFLLGGIVLRVLELILGGGYEGVLTSNLIPFALIILGGGLYAISSLFYYVLVILRKQNIIFIIYTLGAVAAFLLSSLFVKSLGIFGAAVSYVLLMLIIMLSLFILGRIFTKRVFEELS